MIADGLMRLPVYIYICRDHYRYRTGPVVYCPGGQWPGNLNNGKYLVYFMSIGYVQTTGVEEVSIDLQSIEFFASLNNYRYNS